MHVPVIGLLENEAVENGNTRPLLMNSKVKSEDGDDNEQDDDGDSHRIQKPVTSIVSAYKLLTPSVKVKPFLCIILYINVCIRVYVFFQKIMIHFLIFVYIYFQVQLFIYFMLKYAMEILLAESSVITEYYFMWSTDRIAIFLACLGLTVLPVNILIGSYISNIFEERLVFTFAD